MDVKIDTKYYIVYSLDCRSSEIIYLKNKRHIALSLGQMSSLYASSTPMESRHIFWKSLQKTHHFGRVGKLLMKNLTQIDPSVGEL